MLTIFYWSLKKFKRIKRTIIKIKNENFRNENKNKKSNVNAKIRQKWYNLRQALETMYADLNKVYIKRRKTVNDLIVTK